MDCFKTLHQEEEEMNNLLNLDDLLSEPETLDKPAQTEKATKGIKKKTGFRMYGKNFILTFPQCSISKELAVERLEQKWKDEMKGYVVCEEQHKDGTPHLHVYLSFHERKQFKKSIASILSVVSMEIIR